MPSGEAEFGVYIHWPFCAAKCPYCDFNSHVRHTPVDQRSYGQALAAEIGYLASLAPGRTVASIFFGGGTPSLMAPETVETVLSAIAGNWSIAGDVEISLEANPSSADAGRFKAYRAAGVNRLSLGVQALNDADLRFLGRLHDVAEATKAIDLARAVFPRLSFDLIYARPGQSAAEWQAELEQAIDLAADHLSLYQLTIEHGTPFWNLREAGKLRPPATETAAQLYELTQAVTRAKGLPAYEISNHAKPGAECRHNLVYWRYGEYAGAGPGAHGRLNARGGRLATVCAANPEAWLQQVQTQGHGLAESELLTLEAAGDEFLLMQSRLREGFDPDRYRQLTGRALSAEKIADLTDHGMLEWLDNGCLRVTGDGWLVLDAVVADLAA